MKHKFEIAGLGKAPFKVLGFSVEKYQAGPGAPIQPGGSCDFCGTAIMNTFWIQGSGQDDRRFKVGCDCVAKTGDDGLKKVTDATIRKHQRKLRHAREAARIDAARYALETETVCNALAAQPHPLAWRAAKGDTLLDWANWMMENSGNAGCLKVARTVTKAMK